MAQRRSTTFSAELQQLADTLANQEQIYMARCDAQFAARRVQEALKPVHSLKMLYWFRSSPQRITPRLLVRARSVATTT